MKKILILLFISEFLNSQICFQPFTTFTTGGSGQCHVTSADWNLDGKKDVLVCNNNNSFVSLLLGNGLGSFTTTNNFNLTSTPAQAESGDFNNDGKPDLAVAGGPNNLWLLLGNGNGSFTTTNNFNAGMYPNGLVTGDFNNDGNLDVIVANGNVANTICVLLGTGTGSFNPGSFISVGTCPCGFSLSKGDLNNDGKLDIAVANQVSNNISILLGNGNGTFNSAINYSVGGNEPWHTFIYDFNLDGKLDIATPNRQSNNISVLFGNGVGGFTLNSTYNTGLSPRYIDGKDINNDGIIDLIVPNMNSNSITVLTGNLNGTFNNQQNFNVSNGPFAVCVNDFNNDNKLDIVSSNYFSGNVSLLLSTIPIPNIVQQPSIACAGQILTLSATGASNYTWQPSGFSGNNYTIIPNSNTVISVIGSSNNCIGFKNYSISVNNPPIITLTTPNATLCQNSQFTIIANGANSYTWSNNFTGNSLNIILSNNTVISVIGTSTNGCTNTSSIALSVNPLPTLSIAGTTTLCAGQSINITASGANTYTWSNNSNNSSITISPTISSSYSVSGTSTAGCISASAAISNVTVYALPVITANSGSICNGQNFTISPSGANTYTIQGGNAVVSPSVNSSYTVSGTSTAGCISASAAVATVTVYTLPQISVNSGTICNSQSFTLVPIGANTYTISGGNTIISPSITTSYSVTGTSTAGCISASAAVATVSVNQNPILSITGNTLLCTGETGTITVSGANAYAWSNGATSTSITINNTPNTYNYTVTGTGTNSCTASTTVQVLINACTSIAQNQNKYLDIYPNPASSLLNIGASDQAIGKTLKIFDAQSKLIQVLVLKTNNVLQLSDWAKGIYLIQVSELGISKRIVIE